MRIPLHLHPHDYSPSACSARLALQIEAASLNPKGFRNPSARSGKTRNERLADAAGDAL